MKVKMLQKQRFMFAWICVCASILPHCVTSSLFNTQTIECDEIKADDSYDESTCTISKILSDGSTEFNFMKNDIRIWWFIKKDLNFKWFTTIRVINSNVVTIPRAFMIQYESMEKLSIENCSVQDWHPLTFMHAKNLRQLLLPRNEIKTIPRIAFYNANVLEVIDLQYNRITEVDKYAFINLQCLKELKLNNNQIFTLDLQLLININLRYLDASHNVLSNFSIESETVHKRKPKMECKLRLNDNHLESLYIQESFPITELYLQNNKLNFLSATVILKDLKILNVESNPLHQIPLNAFFHFNHLQYLNLKDTQFNSVNGALFSRLTHLKHLDLSNNNFTAIDWNMLAAMGELEELVLLNNLITEADAEHLTLIFPKLKHVWISSKTWECQDFEKLTSKLKPKGIKVNSGKGQYGTEYDGSAICVSTLYL